MITIARATWGKTSASAKEARLVLYAILLQQMHKRILGFNTKSCVRRSRVSKKKQRFGSHTRRGFKTFLSRPGRTGLELWYYLSDLNTSRTTKISSRIHGGHCEVRELWASQCAEARGRSACSGGAMLCHVAASGGGARLRLGSNRAAWRRWGARSLAGAPEWSARGCAGLRGTGPAAARPAVPPAWRYRASRAAGLDNRKGEGG